MLIKHVLQVKFQVEFEGTPAPKISWYKDGFELLSNRRQRVNTDNGVSTLYIHQAEYSDEGEIKCSATNRAGHAITKARLRLEGMEANRLLIFKIVRIIHIRNT